MYLRHNVLVAFFMLAQVAWAQGPIPDPTPGIPDDSSICVRFGSPPTIDGDLSDWIGAGAVWKFIGAPTDVGDGTARTDGWDGPDDMSSTWSTMWDDNYLYFATAIRDDVLNKTPAPASVYTVDTTILYMDLDGDGVEDFRAAVSINTNDEAIVVSLDNANVGGGGRVLFPNHLAAHVMDARLGPGGRFVEAAIPMVDLQAAGLTPSPGGVYGLNPAQEESYLTTIPDGRGFVCWGGNVETKLVYFAEVSGGFRIESVGVSDDDVVLSWIGTPRYLYTLQQTVDPGLAPEGWTDVPSFQDVPGVDGPMMTTTTLAGASMEAYRLNLVPPPPVFEDDLEFGAVGWTNEAIAGATLWELGTPNYTSARGVFTNAASGSNAWATGLMTPYTANDITVLRTPVIDLSGMSAAVLSFVELKDLEPQYDNGYVSILNSGGAVIGTNLYRANGTSDTWTQRKVTLTPYTNQEVMIEFKLVADHLDFEEDYFGWAIDDISVGVTAPPPPPPPPPPPFTNSVVEFILVDSTGANTTPPDLVSITDGATLDLDALGASYSNVNVRAEVDGDVGSVTFALTGATTHNQSESVGPYYLFGDASGDPNDGTLSNGVHNLVATPFEGGGGSGQTGTNLVVSFTVTSTSAP